MEQNDNLYKNGYMWNEQVTKGVERPRRKFATKKKTTFLCHRAKETCISLNLSTFMERICLILRSLFSKVPLMWWKIRLLWIDRGLSILVVSRMLSLMVDIVRWLSLIVVGVR